MMISVAVRESAAGGTFLLEHTTARLTATAHFTDFCPFVCVKKRESVGIWFAAADGKRPQKQPRQAKKKKKKILVFLWLGWFANAFTLERNT